MSRRGEQAKPGTSERMTLGRKGRSSPVIGIGAERGGRGVEDPLWAMRYVGKRIREALDPAQAPGKVKTLAEMAPEERARLEKRVGCPIRPESKP